jgi:pyruvate ferredoxin oxidoreductase gamma subunit
VRFHGRGGQGVVTAAELLSVAAFFDGKYAQAFPSFGSERMGAPVTAFCRIAELPIRSREPITDPDALVIQDPTLLSVAEVWSGTGPSTLVLINSSRDPAQLAAMAGGGPGATSRLMCVAATELALEHIGRPIPNVVLLGGLAAATGVVSLESLAQAIEERFPSELARRNLAAAQAAWDRILAESRKGVASHAASN